MNEWPAGWSGGRGHRDDASPYVSLPGEASAGWEADYGPHPAVPSVSRQPGARHPSARWIPEHDSYGGHGDGYYTAQEYVLPADGAGPVGPQPPKDPLSEKGARRSRLRRRVKIGSIVLLSATILTLVGTYYWADSKVRRDVDLSKVIERPAEGPCTTYLIVGSDSREGMSAEDRKRLHTGTAEGKRSDSTLILTKCSAGTTLVSLPRDSEVEIPSFVGSESGRTYPGKGQRVKLNTAYAMDGAELLVRTVEYNTGLRIDHYVEIGFAGFAKIVDAIGGVDLDIENGFKDKKAGADFQAGRQTLNGEKALAFVRTRYAFAESDLQRTRNQQKFLAALASQAATPSTVLNPFVFYPLLSAVLDTVIVDKDMTPRDLGQMLLAMKEINSGTGVSMNMPLSGERHGNLLWDKAKVRQLVKQIQNDETVTVRGR
ncbi:LCP family protein [Streptomyces vinaceus]|uniref:LCP family protein n=1 Tax=Streptomyces vinaceus TaxID=1960 RepID=UPI0037F10205